MTIYGDISPRTAVYAAKQLLKRAIPYMVLEMFGQAHPLPSNSSKTIVFRRYDSLSSKVKVLAEGVTPSATSLTKTDVQANLVQIGDRTQTTDVIQDTHEDNVLSECMDLCGEQAAQMVEHLRWGVLCAGTNVMYANGATRGGVNSPVSLKLIRNATRALKRQNAKPITKIVRSTSNFETVNVAPSYIGLVHPDLEPDVRNLAGFVPAEKYGTMTPYENEIGKVENVRFLSSTIFEAIPDAGGLAATNGVLTTTGTNADVYPVLILGQDAYGIVALKGKYAVTPMVVNAKPSDSDPMAQRSHVSWKAMQTAAILNDLWMVRLEVSASNLS